MSLRNDVVRQIAKLGEADSVSIDDIDLGDESLKQLYGPKGTRALKWANGKALDRIEGYSHVIDASFFFAAFCKAFRDNLVKFTNHKRAFKFAGELWDREEVKVDFFFSDNEKQEAGRANLVEFARNETVFKAARKIYRERGNNESGYGYINPIAPLNADFFYSDEKRYKDGRRTFAKLVENPEVFAFVEEMFKRDKWLTRIFTFEALIDNLIQLSEKPEVYALFKRFWEDGTMHSSKLYQDDLMSFLVPNLEGRMQNKQVFDFLMNLYDAGKIDAVCLYGISELDQIAESHTPEQLDQFAELDDYDQIRLASRRLGQYANEVEQLGLSIKDLGTMSSEDFNNKILQVLGAVA